MKQVIASAGLEDHSEFAHGGTVFHEMDLTEDDAYLEVVADREFRTSAASLIPLFRPRSIAVVGAGREVGGAGRAVPDHLSASEFAGALSAVNPHADRIAGVPCARSFADLPQPVDLAVISLPAEAVVDTAIECGRHDVRASGWRRPPGTTPPTSSRNPGRPGCWQGTGDGPPPTPTRCAKCCCAWHGLRPSRHASLRQRSTR
jgi:predicted CoA-binding protein